MSARTRRRAAQVLLAANAVVAWVALQHGAASVFLVSGTACAAGIWYLRRTAPPAPHTHVLVWSPAWLSGSGDAAWELFTAREYETGRPRRAGVPAAHLPRDAAAGDLAEWAAAELGHAVSLDPGTREIKTRVLARYRNEPIFWVHPA